VDKLVLVIDRDAQEREQIAAILREVNFQVVDVAGTVQGMIQMMEAEPALIVMAEETKPLRLHEVVDFIREFTGAPLMVVGSGGMSKEEELLMRGGDFYLNRPFTAAELAMRAQMLVRRGEAYCEEMETTSPVEQPPEGRSASAENVRPLGMRLLRWDDEGATREATAAS
jgi:DNA-binding response OmpR family regulator